MKRVRGFEMRIFRDFRDFRDFVEIFMPLCLLFAIVIAGVLLSSNYYDEYTCGKYGEVTGRKTTWTFMDTCYVHSGDQVMTKDEYKAVIIAREGLSDKSL